MNQTIETSFVPILYFNVHEQSSIPGVMQNQSGPILAHAKSLVPSGLVQFLSTFLQLRFLLAESFIKVQQRMKCAC